jgi:hypothetical protein
MKLAGQAGAHLPEILRRLRRSRVTLNQYIANLLFICFFLLCGCMSPETKMMTTKNPDATEILRSDKNADIFQWEGLIYQTDIDWVDELKVEKNEFVGEITNPFSIQTAKSVENGMANKLPAGAKIYTAKGQGDILIVEYNGKTKKYLALIEG